MDRIPADEAAIVAAPSSARSSSPRTRTDLAQFETVVAPGYYMYDGGMRFDGSTILDLVKAQYAAADGSNGM
ncbi:MAG: hypothetical protein WDN69_22485 [Aliidongia sp.]